MTTSLTVEQLRAMPKVLLHDHLDGGVRAQTLLEIAREVGYGELPSDDVDTLAAWFLVDEPGLALEDYLARFAHVVALMQTADAIERIAYECGRDLAEDGVVYAEVRFAPELHREKGLSDHEIVDAVLHGFARCEEEMRSSGRTIVLRTLLTAMRQEHHSLEIAKLVEEYKGRGVVGFDLAGPERGFPASAHKAACEQVLAAGSRLTIHAGEGDGSASIADAMFNCHAERLGHGVHIVDDITVGDSPVLGELAQHVLDAQMLLELCPTSNVQTGVCDSIGSHPIELLRQQGFNVTVNTDNRLMSGITVTSEFAVCVDAFGWTLEDMAHMTEAALRGAFISEAEREHLRTEVIAPGFARLC
jgi:adenosine deaminase